MTVSKLGYLYGYSCLSPFIPILLETPFYANDTLETDSLIQRLLRCISSAAIPALMPFDTQPVDSKHPLDKRSINCHFPDTTT